jgi:Matrixin
MRPYAFIAAAAAALVCAAPAFSALPDEGFLVFKDSRLSSVIEVRAKGTGQVVATVEGAGHAENSAACSDPTYVFLGPRWKKFEEYRVNIASTPSHIGRVGALIDIVVAHEAWEWPFVTECPRHGLRTAYEANFGGLTSRDASLVSELSRDGKNVVAFQSLAGTVCDGAAACVVTEFKRRKIREADMALERDLTRYGFADYWTTDDLTWWDATGGRWAVSDVATHEWGHFAGLAHADHSPALTMYPFIHDGAQTLGLGDMRGIAALYAPKRDDD